MGSIKYLRQLKYLTIVDAILSERGDAPEAVQEQEREIWKMGFVSVLKDNPSTDHKVLRWKIIQFYWHLHNLLYDVVENQELEVLP